MPIPFIIAGAAAVAAAVGGKKAYDGYKTKSEADEILEIAKNKYDKRKKQLDALQEIVEKKLEQLGNLELNIGNSFNEFQIISQELLNRLQQNENIILKLDIPINKLEKIKELTFSATEFFKTVVTSGATGAAASFAVYSGVMAFGVASTGTPIAALSGVAAYNATMAAIGGGSLAVGGWGMAGGAMVLGGAAIAPILAIAGLAYSKHAENALKNANQIEIDVNNAILKMDLCDKHLNKTYRYIDKIQSLLEKINQTFEEYFSELKSIHEKIVIHGVEKVTDDISKESLMIINNGYLLAAIMTDIITTPIFKPKSISEDGILQIEVDSDGFNVLNQGDLDKKLNTKEDEYYNSIKKA